MTHACKLFITAGRVEVKVMGNIHYAIAVLTSPCVACFTDFLRRQLQHFILSQVHPPPPHPSVIMPPSLHLHLSPHRIQPPTIYTLDLQSFLVSHPTHHPHTWTPTILHPPCLSAASMETSGSCHVGFLLFQE